MNDDFYATKLDERWQEKSRGRAIKGAAMCLYKFLHLLVSAFVFACGWCLLQDGYKLFAKTTLMLACLFFIFTYCMERVYGGLRVGVNKRLDVFFSQALSLAMANAGILMAEALVIKTLPNLALSLAAYGCQTALSALWCFTAEKLYDRLFPPLPTAVVYGGRRPLDALDGLFGDEKRFAVHGVYRAEDWTDAPEELKQTLAPFEAVFLCAVPAAARDQLLNYCVEHGKRAYIRPDVADILLSGARRTLLFHAPILLCERKTPFMLHAVIKRGMDILLACAALLLASPVMLLTACAVKLCDGGRVFYRQQRLTKNGRIFSILKFRSMRENAEGDGVARLAAREDARITPVGRIIRKTRIDELPQIVNILRGDMSIVGPRPERPELAAQYAQTLPEFDMRLQVRAGLTGYAQVNGKYNTPPEDKLQMDLIYIANQSLLEDAKIIFQTVKTLFTKESTDGVSGDGAAENQMRMDG